MDENYLDNLLNEFSLDKEIDNKIEDELDNQMMEEKHKKQEENAVSKEDAFDMDLNFDADAVTINDDLRFSEEQIDELDQLDNIADLDIGDLDFSDIDFDDLDITKLDDVKSDDFDALLKDFEGDLDIGNLFADIEEKESAAEEVVNDEESPIITEEIKEDVTETVEEEQPESVETEDTMPLQTDDLNADAFDADSFLDSLLDETEAEEQEESTIAELPVEENTEGINTENPFLADSKEAEEETLSRTENAELDDLFSVLDMEDAFESEGENLTDAVENPETDNSFLDGLEDIENLDDIEELEGKDVSSSAKKKKGFMEVLFGEPDEEDILSEEELAAIEAKKEAKKAKKKAAKEAKKEKAAAAKEEKAFKDGQKKKQDDEKKRVKAEKKAKLKAEELANAEPEKKLNMPIVIFIFSLFLGGTFLFYMASNDFNYKQAIEKASTYFANQKYRSAYDEIVGVEVKEEDEELKDRIYTVMYVERLYESYENNSKLGREEKALDALLRGVDKYFEHYEEAGKLGIASDLDYSFNRIQTVLTEKYGISVDRAIEINALENYDYVKTINEYIGAE